MTASLLHARAAWFASLGLADKENILFELEVLISGFSALTHRSSSSGTKIPRDVTRAVFGRCLQLAKMLGGSSRSRPESEQEHALVHESLSALRVTLTHLEALLDGLEDDKTKQHLAGITPAALRGNPCFSSLEALEFRPEYDTPDPEWRLHLMNRIDSPRQRAAVHKVLIVSARLMRITELIQRQLTAERSFALAHVAFMSLHRTLGAFATWATTAVPSELADEVEHALLACPPHDLVQAHVDWTLKIDRARNLSVVLRQAGAASRAEERLISELQLGMSETRDLQQTCARVRSLAAYLVREIHSEVDPDEAAPELALTTVEKAETAHRLQRHIWMSMQVLRAFIVSLVVTEPRPSEKEIHARTVPNFEVFLEKFALVGGSFLRTQVYDRAPLLIELFDRLQQREFVEPSDTRLLIDECNAFYAYLKELFQQVSQRKALKESPLDYDFARRSLAYHLSTQ